MIRILAVDSRHNVGSWLIKIFTFSKWNHVAIMFDTCTVIESTAFNGVTCCSYEDFLRKYSRVAEFEMAIPDEKAAKDFALQQLNKKYDWKAIFGIIFQNRKWESPNRWFCSELVEASLIAGGRRRFRSEVSNILPRETFGVI